MIEMLEIRESLPSDAALIEELYRLAFPDEDLVPVVRDLLEESLIVLSLVGTVDLALVGHVIFTTCGIETRTDKVSLLAPLGVVPAWQKRGIGSALVLEGLLRSADAGVVQVFVLGDPAYYQRFGFEPEAGVTPPYPLPKEWRGAWQSACLNDDEQPPENGNLSVPKPWRQPALWAP